MILDLLTFHVLKAFYGDDLKKKAESQNKSVCIILFYLILIL